MENTLCLFIQIVKYKWFIVSKSVKVLAPAIESLGLCNKFHYSESRINFTQLNVIRYRNALSL